MAKSATAVTEPQAKNGLGIFETMLWECKGSVVKNVVTCWISNEFFEGTYAFESDENGVPKGFKELGSCEEHDHAAAMTDAGFALEEASDA